MRLTTVLATVVLIALPPVALADGAGDEQYQDPLSAPSTPPKKKPARKQATTPSTTTAPASSAPTTSAPASSVAGASTPTATPAASPSGAELPRTGAPAGLIGLSGAAMISAGLALRRRIARR